MQNEAETKKATRQAELKKQLNKATSRAELKQKQQQQQHKKKQEKEQGKGEGKWKLKNGSDVCALLTMDMLKSRPRLPHQRQSQSQS